MPVGLRFAFHLQQAAVFKKEGERFLGFFMLKGKLAVGPETQRGDAGADFDAFFVVAVPAHAFFAAVVEVEQAGVEGSACQGFGCLFQFEQFRGPGQSLLAAMGVGIEIVAFAIPGHFALGDDVFAEDHDFILPPFDRGK